MKVCRLMAVLGAVASASLMTGCASFAITHPGGAGKTTPGSVNLGALVGDVTFPNYVQSSTRFELDSDDFIIIGPVSAEATSSSVLGLVSSGDNGYGKLFAAAQAAGADDVINIKVDNNLKRLLGGLFASSKVKMSGIAIKYRKK